MITEAQRQIRRKYLGSSDTPVIMPLSRGKFVIIDSNDYELVSRFNWHAGLNGYAACCMRIGKVGGKQLNAHMTLHRLLMKPDRGMEADHKNGNRLDCRRVNMRICKHIQNIHNQSGRGGKSQYKGAYWNEQLHCWRSQIKVNCRAIALGYFDSEMDAALAYDKAAIKYFGEFASTNFEVNYGDHRETTAITA